MVRIIADFPSDHDKSLLQIKKSAKAGLLEPLKFLNSA